MRYLRQLACCSLIALSACSSPAPTSIQGGLLSAAEERAARGDVNGAARDYRELAEAGITRAQFRLGQAYLDGKGVPYSVEAAVQWLALAAQAGDSEAMRELGGIYEDSDTPYFDLPVAARWYAAAAELGDESARFALAELAIESAQSPADQQLAVNSLKEGARNGNVRAQLRLAQIYERGKIVAADEVEAARWYAIGANVLKQQAVDGNSRAQSELAQLYLNGKGVRQNTGRAIELLEEASGAGRLSATVSLAKLYRKGARNLPVDNAKAVYWREQALDRNHASSAYELGKWFMRGSGVNANPIRSRDYFQRAAELGEDRALVYLGELHGGNFDILTDYEIAAGWYRQAGEAGDAKALFKLGELHQREKLAASDPSRALALYEASAKGGYTRGSARADRLRRELTPLEQSQADDILTQILANGS